MKIVKITSRTFLKKRLDLTKEYRIDEKALAFYYNGEWNINCYKKFINKETITGFRTTKIGVVNFIKKRG